MYLRWENILNRFFLWKIFHNKLPSNSHLSKIGISSSKAYKRCPHEEENLNHIFFEYINAKQLLRDLIAKATQTSKLKPTEFLSLNCFTKLKNVQKQKFDKLLLWAEILLYCLWTTWITRNTNNFTGGMYNAFFKDAYTQAVQFSHIHSDGSCLHTLTTINIKWIPPQQGTFKLNIDGSCLGNPAKGVLVG
ncbi:hypothetical protein P3S67_010488 [Capsicum chacoense]